MTCGSCHNFPAKCRDVKASDEGCGKWKDWRKSMEKERCQLCGADVIAEPCGMKHCQNFFCGLDVWKDGETFDRIQKALALLKRIEAGNAVVIEKKGGEWPGPLYAQGKPYGCPAWGFEEQAEAWNKGVKGE